MDYYLSVEDQGSHFNIPLPSGLVYQWPEAHQWEDMLQKERKRTPCLRKTKPKDSYKLYQKF